jgi:hypothetical protein
MPKCDPVCPPPPLKTEQPMHLIEGLSAIGRLKDRKPAPSTTTDNPA